MAEEKIAMDGIIPLAKKYNLGLVVAARVVLGEVTAQEDVEHVDVDGVDDARAENLYREGEHPLHGREVDVHRGPPGRIVPAQQGYREDINNALRGQGPISKSHPGHRHAYTTGNNHGCDAGLCLFLHSQVLLQPCALGCADVGKEKAQEGIAAKP